MFSLFVRVFQRFGEVAEPFTEGFTELWQPIRSEDQEQDGKNYHELTDT
jgi:hypothetical protein